ncbi:lantibiotic dehydratase [Streptomyces sp. NBC_01136]|uniref:lantibiotic dehydratase n=1 Tax=unclassified Streptomyces TaxID=2593676 RepID=UPI003251E982|nr:lantibiotic dehydratase [Streptomyces sp. NBC_01136]
MPLLPRRRKYPALPEIADIADSTDDELLAFIRDALAHEAVREAVAVSAPSLADLLDRVLDGTPVRRTQVRKAVMSLSRYLIRAGTRSTPFGLLAGVAPVRFDQEPSVCVGTAHTKNVRVDGGWTAGLVRELEQRPDVLRLLRVVVHDQCVVKGDHITFPLHAPKGLNSGANPPLRRVLVRRSPAVCAVLERAAAPVAVPVLCELLETRFAMAVDRAEAVIAKLVGTGILLTSLRPPTDAVDPLAHIQAQLSDASAAPAVRETVLALNEIAELLTDYQRTSVGAGTEALRRAVRAVRAACPGPSAELQVDLRVDAQVVLPPDVAKEAAAAAGVLWRIAPSIAGPNASALRNYQTRFLDRYGREALVPLMELLDSERGLGYPSWDTKAGQTAPGRTPDAEAAEYAARRAQVLAELAWSAWPGTSCGGAEVVLTPELVEQLARPSAHPPVGTAEVNVSVLASSTADLANGDFQVLVNGGSRQAGALFGRFAQMLPELNGPLRAVLLHGLPYPTVPAQLFYRPSTGKASNVSRSPRWTEHVVRIGEFADRDAGRTMRARDLLIGADESGFYAVHAATGDRLSLVVANVLSDGMSTPAARFLRQISAGARGSWALWDWGSLDCLPRLPRVSYGRSVLAAARWRPDRAMEDAVDDWQRWRPAMEAWKERNAVPDQVRVGEHDRRLDLDLRKPLHQRLLHEELRRRPSARVEETLTSGDMGAGWLNGYASEVVIPLRAAVAPPVQHRSAGGVRALKTTVHPVGGEWLYAKVYAAAHLHNEILAGRLPELLGALESHIDRWFFIRYADPDPHLRLRFHGSPERLLGGALPALHTWAEDLRGRGLARDWSLDAYAPETDRYGGAHALAAAERFFQADSEAALIQLDLQRSRTHRVDPMVLASLSLVDICRGMASDDWPTWLLGRVPREAARMTFRAHRGELRALAAHPYPDMVRELGGETLAKAWEARGRTLVRLRDRLLVDPAGQVDAAAAAESRSHTLSSLLHMHHNRALGSDVESEVSSHAIARGFAELVFGASRRGD